MYTFDQLNDMIEEGKKKAAGRKDKRQSPYNEAFHKYLDKRMLQEFQRGNNSFVITVKDLNQEFDIPDANLALLLNRNYDIALTICEGIADYLSTLQGYPLKIFWEIVNESRLNRLAVQWTIKLGDRDQVKPLVWNRTVIAHVGKFVAH